MKKNGRKLCTGMVIFFQGLGKGECDGLLPPSGLASLPWKENDEIVTGKKKHDVLFTT
jgi:hypothetical protein